MIEKLLWLFFIYAFFGWCLEVFYAALKSKKFVNRGFLNGTVCPIYGVGAICVIYLLTPVKEISIFLLFLTSLIATSTLEFLTGYILEKFFKAKWWDYSNDRFNLKGYICLKFSILWGLACVFVVNDIQPLVEKFLKFLPRELGNILLGIFSVIFLIDIIITIIQLMKIKHEFKVFNMIREDIRDISNAIGEKIFEGATTAMEHTEEIKEKLHQSEKFAELKEKIENYQIMREKRLVKAFPNLINHQQEMIEKIKKIIDLKK